MPTIVRFDCYEVDLAAGQVLKRGAKLQLREQCFQVLAALLEHSGEVVTRDDLRRRLWPDEVFVDFDNNLNTAIARLREVLGDSAERPRFIETLPRHGYRFIGTLSEGVSTPGPAGARRLVAAGDVVAPTSVPAAGRTVPARGPRSRRVLIALLLGVLVVTAFAMAGWRRFLRPAPNRSAQQGPATATEGPADTRPLVAVARFENRTGDRSLDQFGAMVKDYVTAGLGEMPEVEAPSTVMPLPRETAPAKSASAQKGPGDPVREVADETGAGTVVAGAYYLAGDSLQVQARILDVASGRALATTEVVAGPRSDPTSLLEALRQRILGAVGAALYVGLGHATGRLYLSRLPHYDAYREYLAGDELFGAERFGGNYPEAIRHYDRATALDPDFVLPSIKAAVAYQNMAIHSGNMAERERAGAILDRLYERRERLSQVERLLVDWSRAELEGRILDELSRLRDLEALLPRDQVIAYLIGLKSQQANRPAESVAALEPIRRRGRRRGPTASWPPNVLSRSYHLLGKFEDELRVARDAQRDFPEVPPSRSPEARALAALGRLDELDRFIEETLVLPGRQQTVGSVLEETAAELRVHGPRDRALGLARRAVDWHRSLPPQIAKTERAREALGRALYLSEQWGEARQVFAGLASEHPEQLSYQGYLGALAARLGDRKEAARISQALNRVDRKHVRGEPFYHQARIAAIVGEREQAVALLQRALAGGYPWSLAVHQNPDFETLRDYPPFQQLAAPKG